MTLKRLTWEECRILWEAKGYKLDSIAAEFIKEFGENTGYSRSSLAEHSKSLEEAPPEVVELIGSLELVPGASQRKLEVVQRGLEKGASLADLEALLMEVGGKLNAILSLVGKPRELALALLANFPTDEFALKLADALRNQAAIGSGAGSLFDIFAQAIAGRLPRMPKLRTAKLARLLARHLTRQLDRLSMKRLAVAGAAGGAGACVVGLMFVVGSGRSQANSTQQPMIIVANAAAGGAPLVFDTKALLSAVTGQMGEKVVDRPIPSQPLPKPEGSAVPDGSERGSHRRGLLHENRPSPPRAAGTSFVARRVATVRLRLIHRSRLAKNRDPPLERPPVGSDRRDARQRAVKTCGDDQRGGPYVS